MSIMEILSGTLHQVPTDIEKVLKENPDIIEKRNNLTELARNEWICRVTIVKQEKTREEHIERLLEDIEWGKKRPCCRPGCPHRRPNAAKYFK